MRKGVELGSSRYATRDGALLWAFCRNHKPKAVAWTDVSSIAPYQDVEDATGHLIHGLNCGCGSDKAPDSPLPDTFTPVSNDRDEFRRHLELT